MRCPVTLLLLAALLAGAGCAASPSAPSASRSSQSASGAGAPAAGAQAAPQPANDTPQPAGAAAGSADTPGTVGGGPAQTSEERRAAIDQRLNASLGAFDAQLHQEQQQVAQERDARQSAAAASAAAAAPAAAGADKGEGSADTEGPPGEGERKDGRPGSGRRHDPSGDLKSEKASKPADDNAGNGAVAREIPDGSDDDVVARRLRQAAERETDPELKEKLWQEYLDYKKNAQGK